MGSAHQLAGQACVRLPGASWGASGGAAKRVSARGPLGQEAGR